MRAVITPLSTIAAAVLCAAAAAHPAAAQQHAAAPGHLVRPAVSLASNAAAAAPRQVAVYRLAAPRRAGVPAEVVVADSAGQLVASYRLRDSRVAHPMMVTVLGPDLVLQAKTPSGVFTLQLLRQHEPEAVARRVEGRWWLGDLEGTLRGRVGR